MIHNDYIMKMIAQLAKAMQQILSLRASRRDDDALREIDLTMQRIVGLNSQLVNTLSPESLRETLRGGTDLDVGKALVIADLEPRDDVRGHGRSACVAARLRRPGLLPPHDVGRRLRDPRAGAVDPQS